MAKNNYFDNEGVEEALLKYRDTINEETGQGNVSLLDPYTEQIQTLVRIVINVHKIYRFHNDLDELVQEGLVAVYGSFGRFNPEKGTAFNYLSITVKNHLKNWTQAKNRKAWVTTEYNDSIYDDGTNAVLDHFFIQETLAEIELKPELEAIIDEIIQIISKDKIYNKRDIIKVLVRQGYERSDIGEVYEAMEDHFGIIGDDEEDDE